MTGPTPIRNAQAGYTREFARMCRLLMLAKGSARSAAMIEPDSQSTLLHNVFTRSDPGAIGGDSPTAWAGALVDYKVIANAFLASLRSVGVFDAMLPSMIKLPFRTRILVTAQAIVASDVGEGESKPVSDMDFGPDVLDVRKSAGLAVISEELARLVTAEALIENELRNAVVASVDRDFIAELIGATTPVASSGSALEDLATLFASVQGGSASSWFFIIPVAAAAQLATASSAAGGAAHPFMTPMGGTLAGVTTLVSDQIDDEAVLVDASQIAVAAEGLAVEVATHATVGIESPGALVSLWQANLRGIRAERWWAATVLRSSAVGSLSGVGYSGGSPQ